MNEEARTAGFGAAVISPQGLEQLIGALRARQYRVIGPVVRDSAIIYDDVNAASDLPTGWTDQQQPAQYRLTKGDSKSHFGFTVGPQPWKKFLHLPVAILWKANQSSSGTEFTHDCTESSPTAFLGVRACELHAIAIQDKVLLGGPYKDPIYERLRKQVFIVAVNCTKAGGTCFCASMNSGPRVTAGYDLALTEFVSNGSVEFVVEVGSSAGADVLKELPSRQAEATDLAAVERVAAETTHQMGRSLDTTDISALLTRNREHPRWDEVAKRCLGCANCTLVCPTCFCTTIEDVTDITGQHAERRRRWDSCFSIAFSYLHGGSIRTSARARYRQWLTHKLGTWHDQFGSSGCVGCGRCITWCPVGIDITEEAAALRRSEPVGSSVAMVKE